MTASPDVYKGKIDIIILGLQKEPNDTRCVNVGA